MAHKLAVQGDVLDKWKPSTSLAQNKTVIHHKLERRQGLIPILINC